MTNVIKQAAEFDIGRLGQRFVPFSLTTVDIEALGNKPTQGMPLVLSYYWDESDKTKAWADRFKKAFGKLPSRSAGQCLQRCAALSEIGEGGRHDGDQSRARENEGARRSRTFSRRARAFVQTAG